ncbi:hypothetical protein [Wenzhouxiangella marina]|uniref:hypothetical protein n=1 Tax=Wenzhouxiangella marina TaxID=1579979 RepID=UPI0012E28ED7|nr:hypothetical protein [Wenzhouxiangella marina]MBB6088661.1 hypothetical protein [Wenzhouxiangella marina]
MRSAALAIFALVPALPTYGTGPQTLPELVEYQLESRALQESAVAEAQATADTIFTGIATQIWKDHELRRVYVEFEVQAVHRGYEGIFVAYYDEANSAQRLQFDSEPFCPSGTECVRPEDIVNVCIGCLPDHHKIQPFTETYRYLVYLDGDRIIRQSEYVDWVMPMRASEELELLEGN